MKLNLLLIILGTVQVFATSYSQDSRINISMENGTIVDIFNEIEKQSEYRIFYRMNDIDLEKKYTVSYTNELVSDLLPEVLKEANNTYQLVDKIIVITTNEMRQLTVTGTLTDASTGEPLPGVYVMLEGTNTGVITDASGKYSLQIADQNANLVFKFVGYTTQTVALAGRSVVDVQLAPEIQSLEEVVVIGYGTQKKIDLTGSVSVVASKEFEKAPVTDALDAIQGKVAGVTIISNSGEPGAEKNIRIRGIQSWSASISPLYVIDGVIMDNMNSLSPNDIENISILKDAASSAIYGARAANGVVLITTKRGARSQAPVISFEAYAGVQQYSDLQPKRLNSTQWLELDRESYENAGPNALDQSPYGTQNPVDMSLFRDAGGNLINTDWLDVVSQPGRIQNYDLSLRGGNERSTYFTSATYFNQDGLILNTGADRVSFRFNSDHKVNNFIEFGNSVNIYSHSRFGGVGNPYLGAIRKNPLSRPYETDAEGNIINYDYVRNYTMEGGDVGPLIYAKEYKNDSRTYGFVGNVFLKIHLLKGLTFTPRLSLDYRNSENTGFTPELHITGVETQSINSVYKGRDYSFHWIADYMLNYERSFNNVHNVSALAVYSQEESKYEILEGTRFGTPNNRILYLSAGQLENQSVYNRFQDWSFVSYIGRIGYNYDEKYYIQASVRRDGTSRFIGDNRWGVFPSVSAGWRISKERLFEPLRGIVNDLKIRGSMGTLGNSNVGLYPTYATLEMHTGVMGPTDAQVAIPTYALGALVDPNVKWETTRKTDIGFDAALLNNKVTVSFDYYKSHTVDLLMQQPVPLSAGKYFYDGWVNPYDPTINGGEIENHGVELTLGYQERKGDFAYGVNGNFSAERNKVVDLEGRVLRESGLEVGQPIFRYFGYTSNGIVKSQADLDNNPYLTNTENEIPIGLGDIWTVDVNGRDAEGKLTGRPDGKISADDRGFIGKKYPDFVYGLSGYVTYKRWTLQVVAHGVQGIDLNTMVDINGYFQYTSNDVVRVLDRWHETKNPDGNMPKITKADAAGNATRTSDFWLSDASFLKISNVNLRYLVPENICQKLRMRDLEVYGSVENLHTFTKFPGGEVDVTDQGMWNQPVTKIPQPRTWVLGLKVSF